MTEQIANNILHLYHKECVKCEGLFQRNEKIIVDASNRAYCEVCYKEEYES